MDLTTIKSTIESVIPHNAPLRMDTNLHKIIPTLCNIGMVAVRPSKTGIRMFITVVSEAGSAITGLFKIKVVAGGTTYQSLDLDTGDIAETITEETDVQDHQGGQLSAHVIKTLCSTYNVAIRPSKTGIRMFSQHKETENANVLKERFLLDGTQDETLFNVDGEKISYNLVYAPYGEDEIH